MYASMPKDTAMNQRMAHRKLWTFSSIGPLFSLRYVVVPPERIT